ncbi:MAG: RIP metalloprotease RseP [Bacillota bacterium]
MTLIDWLWAIPVFGLLIFIHELGHFAVAKFFDIRVHEFALGFGPVLVGFDRGETRYNLRAIPLGGFVRMAGMDETEMEDPRGFNQKSVLARSLTIAAGPFMNFVLASLLFSGYIYHLGVTLPDPVLGDLMPECTVLVDGQPTVRPCPSVQAGLKKGDRVLSVDGTPVQQWTDILSAVTTSEGRPMRFQVQRGGEVLDLTVTPIFQEGRYLVGIMPSTQRGSLLRALAQGPEATVNYTVLTMAALVDAVTGRTEVPITGPVGITREIATHAAQGLENLLMLTAVLSVNLAIFNLLPIPALDGSRLVFILVEKVRGKRIDPQRENMVHFVGFLLLIGLIVVVTYGDIFGRQ